jgi:hypothetical protein
VTTRTVLNISVAPSDSAAGIWICELFLAELTCFLPFLIAVWIVAAASRTPAEHPSPRKPKQRGSADERSYDGNDVSLHWLLCLAARFRDESRTKGLVISFIEISNSCR